jgi:hypothetical protein
VAGSYATVIEKNSISRPARTGVTDFYGIYFTTEKNAGCAISKNRIFNPFGGAPNSTAAFYGINSNNSSGSTGGTNNENVVSNNLIYDVNGTKRGELEQDVIKNIPVTIWFRNEQLRQGVLFYRVLINNKMKTGKMIQVN